MGRLPVPGEDKGTWGSVLNDFLQTSHTTTGALKTGIVNTQALADNAVTDAKIQAGGIAMTSVAGLTATIAAKANTASVPTQTSQLTNNGNGTTSTPFADISGATHIAVVSAMPTTPDPNTLYFVKSV